ncbi:MAG: hypothetical protein QOE65_380 [Solirubrobacteraceae bacterium]|nr:hypothetical protein [Solirubrobacteraceae bacterium]
MRPGKAAICVALAAGALLAPARADAASCAYTGSRDVLSTPAARIYYTPAWRPYSCYRITGRRVALDTFVDRFYAPRDAHLGQLRTTGRVLGFTWVDPGLPAVYVQSLDMRLARFRRRAIVAPSVSAEPSAVRVTDLVVRQSGAIAWVQQVEGETSVWRLDAGGRARLDAGEGIGTGSLSGVSATRVGWDHDGVARSAVLR